MERDRRLVGVDEPIPGSSVVDICEALVDRLDHHEHRLDRRIVPPCVQEPMLVFEPSAKFRARLRLRLAEASAEAPRARPRRVLKLLPALLLTEPLCAPCEVPMQQEQGREPLLPIEG